MITWITGNSGTILITLLLALIVTGTVLSIIKDKKQGKSTCGGNCAHCMGCAACRGIKEDAEMESGTKK